MTAARVREAAPVSGPLRLEDLYRRHAPEARRLAYLLTGDRAEADDVVQDAFVKLAGRLFALRSPDASGAYLRRVVVNTVLSRSRSRRRDQARQDRSARLSGVDAWADHEPPDGPLWDALQRLPERQRAAIVLRHWLDLSEERTAELLGCPPGTVKSQVSRGLATMRETMNNA
ncbi:MAG: SigE family RNA polymerase sigma factor [Acidimicrobiales bacterium]